jgi:hypothetical protein
MYHSRDIIPVKLDPARAAPMALLAIVNSRLISWWHSLRSPKAKKALFPKVLVSDVKRIPVAKAVPRGDADDPRVDKLCALAERMCDLVSCGARTPQAKTSQAREVAATDRAIDRLVYDLYGLTDDEIAIVESAMQRT